MKHILCYGDSNTFGTDPIHGGRHPDDVRWTGVLQKLLGSDYRVIEEAAAEEQPFLKMKSPMEEMA